MKKTHCWFILCKTANEHYRGPYSTKKEAQRRSKYLVDKKLCKSYSEYQKLFRLPVEFVDDQRFIFEGKVFWDFELHSVSSDGSVDKCDFFCYAWEI